MQRRDEAARRERELAQQMRRYASSEFLADSQYFGILDNLALQREFTLSIISRINQRVLERENQAAAGQMRRYGRMRVGNIELMRGELVGPAMNEFITWLNNSYANNNNIVRLAVEAHNRLVNIFTSIIKNFDKFF
ncbi:hypothetical protein niasHT_010472 [Heterodera trifolii]|uniref:Uncharacterized protein n=1 Tax=Heterodera trifolii TaxID=157864 RepID=A0ABD2KQ03_9BILA